MSKGDAKEKIKQLMAKYEQVKSSNRLRDYKEEETKSGFISPLFAALGWDMADKYEVSMEEHISGDRADYGFYLNGIPKFYVEAKKLSADINDPNYAKQAIRYAWNKGVTYSVLTDFESVKLYNAKIVSDELIHKLIFNLSFNDFIGQFDKLRLLSRESFESGALDKYAEDIGKKYKKITVTEELSKDLNECRLILTEGFKMWNKVSEEELDEGVQKLINRLVFMKVLEDREMEPPIITPILNDWKSARSKSNKQIPLYKTMISKFRELDSTYNSNIFGEHPFEQWEDVDNATERVINILYGKPKGSEFEYDFKLIPADVLGTVYESYLGYKLGKSKKNSKKEANISKDSKKRKEQGIYYTPAYIVDYIVENALGPVLEKCSSIMDLKNVKVLDPACGSGSFLTKAMDLILKRYEEIRKQKLSPFERTATKIQILGENLYGVDLDPQAVEICRLNLLINVAEVKFLLPSLSENIKNGNSLISGTDEELKKYFGPNFRNKKPFNWQEEFPEVFKKGGFDVIIGNPPYIKEFVNKSAFDGLHNSPYYQGKMDIWTMFACFSIDFLKNTGIMSFIAPNNWVSNTGASIFRDKVLAEGELKTFIDFGDYKVFEHAGIQTMIYIFEKHKPSKKYTVEYLRINDKHIEEGRLIAILHGEQQKIEIEPEKLIGKNITFVSFEAGSIFDKLDDKRNFELNDNEISNGIHHHHDAVNKDRQEILGVGFKIGDGIFILNDDEKKMMKLTSKELQLLKPSYTTEQLHKWYGDSNNKEWVIYTDSSFKDSDKIDSYPNIKKHLDKFKEVITSDNKPYGLHRAKKEKFFKGEKIIALRKCLRPTFTYVNFDSYVSATFYIIKTERINQKYLTAVLNSSLIAFWLRNKGKMQGNNYQLDKEPLMSIPIHGVDQKEDKPIITLVDKMLLLNKEFYQFKENSEKWQKIKEEIDKTDKKIDEEVYKLYGLTSDEIKIVEGDTE